MSNSGKKKIKSEISTKQQVFAPTSPEPVTGAWLSLQEGGMKPKSALSGQKNCWGKLQWAQCISSSDQTGTQWSPWALVWDAGLLDPTGSLGMEGSPCASQTLQRKDCAPCSILFQRMLLKTSFPILTEELSMLLLLLRAVHTEIKHSLSLLCSSWPACSSKHPAHLYCPLADLASSCQTWCCSPKGTGWANTTSLGGQVALI